MKAMLCFQTYILDVNELETLCTSQYAKAIGCGVLHLLPTKEKVLATSACSY